MVLLRWCGGHRAYFGRRKFLGVTLTTFAVWRRAFWTLDSTHGMCDACRARFGRT